ncbi:MAG: RDD family protein [Candidatus Bathyarchaeota archaeon]|nr:RDD family protein [Candidatus Bathyarchaeota archaeon]
MSESSLQQHWVKRVIDIVIDSIIVAIATAILGLVTDIAGVFNLLSFPFAMGLIYVLYFTITESLYGYTIGKRLVNLRVETLDGRKPGLQSAFIRNISKIHFLFLILDTIGGFFTSKDHHQNISIKSRIQQLSNTSFYG